MRVNEVALHEANRRVKDQWKYLFVVSPLTGTVAGAKEQGQFMQSPLTGVLVCYTTSSVARHVRPGLLGCRKGLDAILQLVY